MVDQVQEMVVEWQQAVLNGDHSNDSVAGRLASLEVYVRRLHRKQARTLQTEMAKINGAIEKRRLRAMGFQAGSSRTGTMQGESAISLRANGGEYGQAEFSK